MTAHVVAEGTWNTVLCRDIAPGAEHGVNGRLHGALRDAYDHAWWWEVCPHWPVPPEDASSLTPVRSDVPVLVLAGGLAPTTPVDVLRSSLSGLSRLSLVVDPTGSHNVVGGCLGDVRDAWLQDLQPPPARSACPHRLEW
jgi:hypothetical protein